jgi:hypothetical protein
VRHDAEHVAPSFVNGTDLCEHNCRCLFGPLRIRTLSTT